uniref:Uncharacterized protein n=1 Tax=Zea mays TaxID=4577 RepID=A0A804QRE6_MAIZE
MSEGDSSISFYIHEIFWRHRGLQGPNSVFQVSLVPAPKLPEDISLGLQFVVVDAFAPVASLNFRSESLQDNSIYRHYKWDFAGPLKSVVDIGLQYLVSEAVENNSRCFPSQSWP